MYEKLGVNLQAYSFIVGIICGVVSFLIFDPLGKIVAVHFAVYLFFPCLLTTFVYHNIWMRQLSLPAIFAVAIYSYLKFHGSDLTISLHLCGLAVITRIWIAVMEARAITGKIKDFWRSFLYHPTDWTEEFKMS